MKVNTDGVLLGAWVRIEGAKKVLDIGTGTGVIALMQAQKNKEVQVDAVEIDEDAAMQCRENFKRSGWQNRLTVYPLSIQKFIHLGFYKAYDLIISNPPYFEDDTLPKSEAAQKAKHGAFLDRETLLETSQKLLQEKGKLAVIYPTEEGKIFQELAKTFGFYLSRVCEIKTRTDKPISRLMMEFVYSEKSPVKSELIIHSGISNAYTDEYKNLTKAFYLNF